MHKSFVLSVSVLMLFVYALSAQDFEAKQLSLDFSGYVLSELSGQDYDADPEGAIEYLFETSTADLIKAAREKGLEAEVSENVMYVSGDKLRIDTHEDGMKVSQIILLDSGDFYNIMWERKIYHHMTLEDIKQMQARAQGMMKTQQESMKAALENLPPETRAKMEAQMQMMTEDAGSSEVKKTGRIMKINGFDCEEYRVENKREIEQIWASKDSPFVRPFFENMLKNMPQTDGQDDDWNVWQKIPGAWPVVSKTVSLSDGEVDIEEMVSIDKTTVDESKFNIPADFTKKSMMDKMP